MNSLKLVILVVPQLLSLALANSLVSKSGDDPVHCPILDPEAAKTLTVTLPDPKSCTKFYMCVRATPVLMSCPPGLHFYEKDGRCEFPEVVKCTKEDEKPTPLLLHEDDSDCRQADPRAPVEGVNCPAPHKQADGTAILFKDPHSCKCFYKCLRGLAYRLACPEGLHYNAFLKVCDYPAGANCEPFKSNSIKIVENQPALEANKVAIVDSSSESQRVTEFEPPSESETTKITKNEI